MVHIDEMRRALERRAAQGDPKAEKRLFLENLRAGVVESGIGRSDVEYGLVKGLTYGAGLHSLRSAAQEELYHPRSMLAGQPRPRSLLFKENLDIRKIVLRNLKEAITQGLEDFETAYIGGERISAKERAQKFWDIWLDSSAAHHYNFKDPDKFTLIEVCEDLLTLEADDKRKYIPKTYDPKKGREFKRTKKVLYNQDLNKTQAINHEWWIENAGSPLIIGEYFDAAMEAGRILHPEGEKRDKIMGVYLPSKEKIKRLGDHLRALCIFDLGNSSSAGGNDELYHGARFARVTLKPSP